MVSSYTYPNRTYFTLLFFIELQCYLTLYPSKTTLYIMYSVCPMEIKHGSIGYLFLPVTAMEWAVPMSTYTIFSTLSGAERTAVKTWTSSTWSHTLASSPAAIRSSPSLLNLGEDNNHTYVGSSEGAPILPPGVRPLGPLGD